MGGHQFRGGAGDLQLAVVRDEFDLVQTLLRMPGHGPDPGVEHHVWPIPDGPLDGTQLAGVMRLARAAGEALRVMGAVTVLLIICGFIEGYVSPDPEVPRWARVTIGVGYWLFMISFLRGYVFGRSRGGPAINA